MKRLLRNTIAFLFLGPIVALVLVSSPFLGKAGAIRFWGPALTFFARLYIMALVPRVKSASGFDRFKSNLKSRLWLWKPFFDVRVSREDEETIGLHVANCPFCEALQRTGFQGLAPYVCEADWQLARKRKAEWDFERSRQIGTGDDHCNTTYKRKGNNTDR